MAMAERKRMGGAGPGTVTLWADGNVEEHAPDLFTQTAAPAVPPCAGPARPDERLASAAAGRRCRPGQDGGIAQCHTGAHGAHGQGPAQVHWTAGVDGMDLSRLVAGHRWQSHWQ